MYVFDCLWENNTMLNAWEELCSPNMCMLKKQFWDFETKCRLELPLGILNSTFIRPVKTDLWHPYYSFILYGRAALAWSKEKPEKNQQRSLRNEKLKANRASVTEEQRRERLRIRCEQDRGKKQKKKTRGRRKGRQQQKTTRISARQLSKDRSDVWKRVEEKRPCICVPRLCICVPRPCI